MHLGAVYRRCANDFGARITVVSATRWIRVSCDLDEAGPISLPEDVAFESLELVSWGAVDEASNAKVDAAQTQPGSTSFKVKIRFTPVVKGLEDILLTRWRLIDADGATYTDGALCRHLQDVKGIHKHCMEKSFAGWPRGRQDVRMVFDLPAALSVEELDVPRGAFGEATRTKAD